MGTFEKFLLWRVIQFIFRWLSSNEKNSKYIGSGFQLLDEVDKIATGESQVADSDGEALSEIHKMIEGWANEE